MREGGACPAGGRKRVGEDVEPPMLDCLVTKPISR